MCNLLPWVRFFFILYHDFKISFLFLWVILIASDGFSREYMLFWIYMCVWYVSRIGPVTRKRSDVESMPCISACAEMQIAPISAKMSISAGSVTLQGCTIRNQFCSWRLLKMKRKCQVPNQCDMIIFFCTWIHNYWSPRNYIYLKNGLGET